MINIDEKALDLIESGKAVFTQQNHDKATITKIIKKEFALIDWTKSAKSIYNQVRAFNPAPVAFTIYNGQPFKVFECEVVDFSGNAGEVISSNKELIVACGEGAISLKTVQKAGGNKVSAKDFLLGNNIEKGFVFGKW